MSAEATCAACGSVYRGDAIGALDVDRWERRGEVLHELRWCLCQRDRRGVRAASGAVSRGSAVTPRPDLGANVVMVNLHRFSRADVSVVTIARGTATQWTAEGGAAYVRHGQDAGRKRGDRDSFARIPPDELARLEAWAASQPRGKASP